ncbi:MAG: M23 family metallopeptidase [Elusimicrobiota bacterium]|nr:M23 family metallopeptidase [Elusimicrobiota bacterium]
MLRPIALLLLLAAVLVTAGCRMTVRLVKGTVKTTAQATYGTAKVATKVAYGTAVVAGGLIKDFGYYAARKAFYEKHHDAGDLPSAPVKRVVGRRYPKLPVYQGDYRWPLAAGIVSSEFGRRWNRPHEGLDIAADEGEPVFASAAGEVLYANNRMRGYGNVVILRHDAQVTTLYAHNQSLKVRLGEKVEQGQVIALLGSTGRSTGPHIHFEIRRARTALNPRKVLPKSRF